MTDETAPFPIEAVREVLRHIHPYPADPNLAAAAKALSAALPPEKDWLDGQAFRDVLVGWAYHQPRVVDAPTKLAWLEYHGPSWTLLVSAIREAVGRGEIRGEP